MRALRSLYARLLLWLGFNLVLIAALFFLLPGRGGLGWNVLLSDPVRERLMNIGERIGKDLAQVPEAEWENVLTTYSAEYGVVFGIARERRPPPGGPNAEPGRGLPPDGAPGSPAGPGAGDGPGPFHGDGPPPEAQQGGPPPPRGPQADDHPHGPPPFADPRQRGRLIAISHPRSFQAYSLLIPVVLQPAAAPPRPLMLTVSALSLWRLLHFLGVSEWLLFALLVIGLSALLWWPFIWGITRTVVRLTRATGDIAAGRFDTRVPVRRGDELGRLAESVNAMAQHLQNYVEGQKQFLADVAHEVTSPLARLQLGLGLLEARAGLEAQRTLQDVQDEAQQMSQLLQELLLFSRAGLQAQTAPAALLQLRPLLQEVLRREDPAQQARLEAAQGLRVRASAPLLQRAIANLVRNALRYAGGGAEPVRLEAESSGGDVFIRVLDRGPGVPEAALPRLGEPFFRPEVSRDRDSGGSGLGLAIVRRCVESCGGSVVFRNREGGGFEALIRLPAA